MYDPDEGYTPSNWRSAFVSVDYSEYQDHWGLSRKADNTGVEPHRREINRRLDALGDSMLSSAAGLHVTAETHEALIALLSLVGSPELAQDPAAITRIAADHPIIRDCLRFRLALRATGRLLATAEERLPALLALIGNRAISPRAAMYLDRTTELFLWGFDAECLVMCRSVLEAALATRLGPMIAPDRPPPGVDHLLGIAGERQVLDGYEAVPKRRPRDRGWRAKRGSALWKADRIRRAGNHAVHNEPALREGPDDLPDVQTAVSELVRVLDELFPAAAV